MTDTLAPYKSAILVAISVVLSILIVLITLLVLLLFMFAYVFAPIHAGFPGVLHYFIHFANNYLGAFGVLFLVLPFAVVDIILGVLLRRADARGQKRVGLSGIVIGSLGLLLSGCLLAAFLVDLARNAT